MQFRKNVLKRSMGMILVILMSFTSVQPVIAAQIISDDCSGENSNTVSCDHQFNDGDATFEPVGDNNKYDIVSYCSLCGYRKVMGQYIKFNTNDAELNYESNFTNEEDAVFYEINPDKDISIDLNMSCTNASLNVICGELDNNYEISVESISNALGESNDYFYADDDYGKTSQTNGSFLLRKNHKYIVAASGYAYNYDNHNSNITVNATFSEPLIINDWYMSKAYDGNNYEEIGEEKYNLYNGVILLSYLGSENVVNIPAKLDKYNIIAVDYSNLFKKSNDVDTVIVPKEWCKDDDYPYNLDLHYFNEMLEESGIKTLKAHVASGLLSYGNNGWQLYNRYGRTFNVNCELTCNLVLQDCTKTIETYVNGNRKNCLVYSCEECETTEIYLPAENNSDYHVEHDFEDIGTVKATCEHAGGEAQKCKYCETMIINETIPKKEHNKVYITKELKPCQSGYRKWCCSICNKTGKDYISSTQDHKYEFTDTIIPCVSNYYNQKCTVCGENASKWVSSTDNHKYVPKDLDNNATCGDNVSVTYVCEYCGDKKIVTDQPLEHIWDLNEPYYSCVSKEYEYKCRRCGETKKVQRYSSTSHDWVVNDQNYHSCNSNNYNCKCSICGTEETRWVGSTTEHVYTWNTANPDCEIGEWTATCVNCGSSYVQYNTRFAVKNKHVWKISSDNPSIKECSKCSEIKITSNNWTAIGTYDGIYLIGYSGTDTKLVIPEELEGIKVLGLYYTECFNNNRITEISFENIQNSNVEFKYYSNQDNSNEYSFLNYLINNTSIRTIYEHTYRTERSLKWWKEWYNCNEINVVSLCENNRVITNCTDWSPLCTCTICGNSYNDRSVHRDSHEWMDETFEVSATCTSYGGVGHKCKYCEQTNCDNSISPVPHDFEIVGDVTIYPCQEVAYQKKCKVCGYTTSVNHTPTESHKYEWIVEPKPCQSGYFDKKCSVCGNVISVYVSSTKQHNYTHNEIPDNLTCGDAFETVYTCTECGDSYATETIEHTWVPSIRKYTYTTPYYPCYSGEYYCVCSRCGVSRGSQTYYYEATQDHDYKLDRESCWADENKAYYICSVCGTKNYNPVNLDKTEHNFVKDPDVDNLYKCSICNADFWIEGDWIYLLNSNNDKCLYKYIGTEKTVSVNSSDFYNDYEIMHNGKSVYYGKPYISNVFEGTSVKKVIVNGDPYNLYLSSDINDIDKKTEINTIEAHFGESTVNSSNANITIVNKCLESLIPKCTDCESGNENNRKLIYYCSECNNAVKRGETVNTHTWELTKTENNHNYYTCSICGKTKKEAILTAGDTLTEGDWQYRIVEAQTYYSSELSDNALFAAFIEKYNGSSTDVTVPEKINGLIVAGIDKNTFTDTTVKKITLPMLYKNGSVYTGFNTATYNDIINSGVEEVIAHRKGTFYSNADNKKVTLRCWDTCEVTDCTREMGSFTCTVCGANGYDDGLYKSTNEPIYTEHDWVFVEYYENNTRKRYKCSHCTQTKSEYIGNIDNDNPVEQCEDNEHEWELIDSSTNETIIHLPNSNSRYFKAKCKKCNLKYSIEYSSNSNTLYEQYGDHYNWNQIFKDKLHKYKKLQTITEPTCNKTGQSLSVCEICGKTEFIDIDKTEHTKGTLLYKRNSTCQEEGVEVYKCSVCSEKFEVVTEEKHNHTYPEDINISYSDNEDEIKRKISEYFVNHDELRCTKCNMLLASAVNISNEEADFETFCPNFIKYDVKSESEFTNEYGITFDDVVNKINDESFIKKLTVEQYTKLYHCYKNVPSIIFRYSPKYFSSDLYVIDKQTDKDISFTSDGIYIYYKNNNESYDFIGDASSDELYAKKNNHDAYIDYLIDEYSNIRNGNTIKIYFPEISHYSQYYNNGILYEKEYTIGQKHSCSNISYLKCDRPFIFIQYCIAAYKEDPRLLNAWYFKIGSNPCGSTTEVTCTHGIGDIPSYYCDCCGKRSEPSEKDIKIAQGDDDALGETNFGTEIGNGTIKNDDGTTDIVLTHNYITKSDLWANIQRTYVQYFSKTDNPGEYSKAAYAVYLELLKQFGDNEVMCLACGKTIETFNPEEYTWVTSGNYNDVIYKNSYSACNHDWLAIPQTENGIIDLYWDVNSPETIDGSEYTVWYGEKGSSGSTGGQGFIYKGLPVTTHYNIDGIGTIWKHKKNGQIYKDFLDYNTSSFFTDLKNADSFNDLSEEDKQIYLDMLEYVGIVGYKSYKSDFGDPYVSATNIDNTEITASNYKYICTKCLTGIYDEESKVDINYSNYWSNHQVFYYKTDERIKGVNHNYVVNREKTSITCGETGTVWYVCTNCGDEYSEETTEPLQHITTDTVVEPTCSEKGYTLHECMVCGAVFKDAFVDTLDYHLPKLDEERIKKILLSCYYDEESFKDANDYIDNLFTEDELLEIENILNIPRNQIYDSTYLYPVSKYKKETLKKKDYWSKLCDYVFYLKIRQNHELSEAVMNKEFDHFGEIPFNKLTKSQWNKLFNEIIILLYSSEFGLDFFESTVVAEPTCTEYGESCYSCKWCGCYLEVSKYDSDLKINSYPRSKTYDTLDSDDISSNLNSTEIIEPLGHEYISETVNATCEHGGYTVFECERCHDTFYSDYTDTLQHDYRLIEENENNKTYRCSMCNKEKIISSTKQHVHDYKITSETKATCIEPKHIYYECDCGDKVEDIQDGKLGHNYVIKDHKDANFNTQGYTVYKCTKCNNEYTSYIPALIPPELKNLTLSLSSTQTSVLANWDKDNNCDGYILKLNGKKYRSVSNQSIMISSLNSGTTYTVSVQSYKKVNGKIFYGPITTKSVTTLLKTTMISTLTQNKKKLVVKWKAVYKATGYELQYSTSNTFVSGKTKTVLTKQKSENFKLKKNTTYYIRIRAYQVINGKKVYSSWSATKSIKAR